MDKVKCKYCSNYIHEWCEPMIDSPDPELLRDCKHFKQKTIFDHIKSLNIDELSECLVEIGWDCNNCSEEERLSDNPLLRWEKCDEQCKLHCKEWLESKLSEKDEYLTYIKE